MNTSVAPFWAVGISDGMTGEVGPWCEDEFDFGGTAFFDGAATSGAATGFAEGAVCFAVETLCFEAAFGLEAAESFFFSFTDDAVLAGESFLGATVLFGAAGAGTLSAAVSRLPEEALLWAA